jgi:hypothetical protein
MVGGSLKAAAHAAVDGAATFEEASGRRLVHCFMGTLGADWDADGVHSLIDRADRIEFESGHWLGHDLGVDADGKIYRFAVQAPQEPDDPDAAFKALAQALEVAMVGCDTDASRAGAVIAALDDNRTLLRKVIRL